MIERERLNPLKENLRVMTDEDMLLLEKSMRDLGVVEPLHVVEYDGGRYYLIVNGNHRFEVLVKKFAMDKIPCVVIGKDWPMERVYVEAVLSIPFVGFL
jgi:ParB-like chromosome segregation protein Spo0J